MIPRKKRRLILIVSIILVILILLVAFLLIYINTDLFKSNKTLFMKYLEKNIENMNETYTKISEKNDYEDSLTQNKYTVDTQINVNNTENIGTTQENTDNVVNQLKIVTEGQVDIANQYNYQQMNLYKGEDSILGLEYIQNSNTYGLRFSDIFQQFLLVDNDNLQDLFTKLGYTDAQTANIPNQLNLDLSSMGLTISDEEKQTLLDKYIEIIKDNIKDRTFSKEENQTIEIVGKSVQVNAYSVTLTKEQLNNLYISILEQLKSDELILGKLDSLETIIDQINQIIQDNNSNSDSQSLRDLFITEIDDAISKINQNNIGQDETKIIVYENMKNTVRTAIQTPEYEITLDFLATNEENFIQFKEDNMINGTTKAISLIKNNTDIEININNYIEGEEEKNISIIQNKEFSGNNMKKGLSIRYEDSDNRVEAYVTQNYQTVTKFDNEMTLNSENSIKLNDLPENELQDLIATVTEGINNKNNEIQAEINIAELQQVLINVGVLKEQQNIEISGTTETEKTRYNSQFEMLKGENLDADSILNAINASQNYISNLEVVSNTELKIMLERNTNSPDIVTTLQNFIEEHKREKYNIDVEYDEQTGLARNLLLTIVVDET